MKEFFPFEWIAEVVSQHDHNQSMRVKSEDLILAGISKSEELISKVALNLSEVNALFTTPLFAMV